MRSIILERAATETALDRAIVSIAADFHVLLEIQDLKAVAAGAGDFPEMLIGGVPLVLAVHPMSGGRGSGEHREAFYMGAVHAVAGVLKVFLDHAIPLVPYLAIDGSLLQFIGNVRSPNQELHVVGGLLVQPVIDRLEMLLDVLVRVDDRVDSGLHEWNRPGFQREQVHVVPLALHHPVKCAHDEGDRERHLRRLLDDNFRRGVPDDLAHVLTALHAERTCIYPQLEIFSPQVGASEALNRL
jgi:hypothetical protein